MVEILKCKLIYFQKLGQWYRRKYKHTEIIKSDSSSVNPFTAVLAANMDKPPRKRTPFHHYFKQHYKSQFKDEYNWRFAIARKEYDDASEEDKENGIVKKPKPVVMRTEIGREFWFLEMEEFREQIHKEAENTHAKAMEEWEESKQVPKTAQQFHQ